MAESISLLRVVAERAGYRLRRLATRLVQVVISYEVTTYGLATLQALGLSLPAMVNREPSAKAAECRRHLQAVVDEVAHFRADRPDIPVTSLEEGMGAALTKEMATCPLGGRYELFPPGTQVVTAHGTLVVTSGWRLGARCVREDGSEFHHGIVVSAVGR